MLGKGHGQHLGECGQRLEGGTGGIWARATFGERPRLRTQCLEGARVTPGSATFRGARSELASIQARQCASGRSVWKGHGSRLGRCVWEGAGHVRGAVKAAHSCAQRVIIRRSIRCLHQQKGPRWISIAALGLESSNQWGARRTVSLPRSTYARRSSTLTRSMRSTGLNLVNNGTYS